MEQPQQRSKSMVFVLVVSAVFLAVATFIAILLLASRPTSEELAAIDQGALGVGGNTIFVSGVPILLATDPSKTIVLVNEISSAQPVATQPTDGVAAPTATATAIPVGPTATFPPTPLPTRDPNPVIFISYTVMQGDSLYSIAEAQNSSIELMAKHGIDAENLVPGAVLERLPIANPAYCPGTRAYVVRDKDTVFRIAAQFGTTVDAIAQLNGLAADYRVDVTQVICIPV